ncbi:leucine-rich PPR motif-containing protein, mitochondrial-like [Pectinophora gossypiella]|uniref:leucine-rich PPR motif-containing protein, mitochondrial-like n=1 Tax=Pectinophora gossypiella TaxID=13191 RepID=UPI00214E5D57|nr:leucine-rich PPR motif-containing protein, mitochondrial-like [Pectinophora gossypiella]
MLSRRLLQITSSSRAALFKNYSVNQTFYSPSCACLCYVHQKFRCKTSTLLVKDVGYWKNEIRFSSTTPLKHKTFVDKKPLANDAVNKIKAINEEDALEKFVAGLSADIHNKKRVYKNDLQRVLSKVKSLNYSSKKQGLLLLQCCTDLLADEAPATRMTLAEQVWNTIKPHTKFEVAHYNELLKIYIANRRSVVAASFIQKMSPIKPNMTTYELLLRAIGEAGDLNQATEVISNMKSNGLPATESIFNSLIVCQGKSGQPNNIQEVLTMMQSLKIVKSADTYTAIARALAWNKQGDKVLEELSSAYKTGIRFGENHIMDIVKTLAECSLYAFIPQTLRFLPEEMFTTPSISPYMQAVSTQLVFQNHPMAALEIYKCLPLPSFGPKDDQGLHGRSLVRDCVKAAMPSSIIGLITQELMASGRNPIALQNAAEAALQHGKVPLALDMFTRMKQIGMPLRCHYFWPILLHSSKSFGEKGIMNALQTMISMEVPPDYETVMDYILPYVSFTSPQNLMKKFQEAGLTTNMVLTPMMETLLNTGQVRAASEICELFEGKIEAEKLLKPLIKGYLISMDTKSTIHVLEDMTLKATDKNKDWVGRFLCHFVKQKQQKGDLIDFLNIVKAISNTPLKISTLAADYCLSRIPDSFSQEKINNFRDTLIGITEEKLIDEGEIFTNQLPHPKHMNEESLRAHLVELEAKGMNTRGVLRKLLQEYCKSGNLAAAREILEKCQKEGVFLSAGMKAAIFDLHVKLGELDLAELTLADLNRSAPNFLLDEYKVIDFATLMVYRGRIDRAFDLINEQSKKRRVIGGRNISMNCWRLLDAVAAQNSYVETRNMFDLLTSLRYCRPTNAVLGPLIRAHLKLDNLVEAVNEFTRLANKYHKTPLKHELLCKILQSMSDGLSEDNFLTNERCNGRLNKLAQAILNIDKKIHGAGDVQLTLIAALADVGYKKTLRKMLLDPTVRFHPDALLRRCERFADERKVHALETIAECGRDLRNVDVVEIYDMILDVLQRDDNVEQAIELWNRMHEQDITPSQKFVRNLCSMAKTNKKPIPPEIVTLAEKQQKAALEASGTQI